MRTSALLAIIGLFFAETSFAAASTVEIYVAPRASRIPASGKVTVDIFIVNHSTRDIQRPAEESVSALYRIFNRNGAILPRIGGNVVSSLHRNDRVRIPAKSTRVITEVLTVDAQPGEIVVVELSVGQPAVTLRANSFVLFR